MHTMFEKCMKKMQSGKDKDHVTIYFPNSRTLVSVNSRSFGKLKVHLELYNSEVSFQQICIVFKKVYKKWLLSLHHGYSMFHY